MFIEFGEINYKLIFLLLYPMFIHLRKIVRDRIEDNYYLDNFRFYLSYIFSIIFILIKNKRSKRDTKSNESTNNSGEKINIEKKEENWINPLIIREKMEIKKKQRQKFAFILLITFVCLITNLFYVIYRIIYEDLDSKLTIGRKSIGLFFEIIYFLILGRPILKNKIYKHHFVSLIIIFFNIILLIINFVHSYPKETFKIISYYSIYNFLFCMSYTLGKLYLNTFYIAPYNLMTIMGIITSFILLIYDIIIYKIVGEKNVKIHGIILGIKNNFNLSFIFLFSFDILLYLLTNIGVWLTLYYFTPFHFIIAEFILYDSSDFTTLLILYILIYIINIFFSLVFNEIIILNIFNLNYNTKKYIKKREREEYLHSQVFILEDKSSNSSKRESLDIE